MDATSRQTMAPRRTSPRSRKRSRPWLIALVVFLALCVVGVVAWREISREFTHGPSLFVLASGSTDSDKISYHYKTFDGLVQQEAKLGQGQTLQLTYAAEATKGSLSLRVEDPAGNKLWEYDVAEGQQQEGTKELTAAQAGTYRVVVVGVHTGGSFEVRWTKQ